MLTPEYRWLWFVWLTCLVAFVHQKTFDGATPVSRLDLLHSAFSHRTFCIDGDHENTPDKALFNGHFYSDKAPGTVALGLPAFGVAAGALKLAGVPLESKSGWLVSSWVACAGSIGIVTALGGAVLFAWLCRWVPPRRALVTVLALFLGAAPLPYATMMFSHALVVGLLAIAIWAASQNAERGTWSAEPGTSKKGIGRLLRWYRWELLAGFACGWVLASEYSAGLAVVGIFLWLVAFAPTAGVTPGTAFPPDPASAAVGSPVREQRPLALSLSASDAERVAKLGEGDSAWLRVPKRDSGLLVAPTPERTPHPGALPVGRGEAARRADEGNGRMPWIRRMISCLDGARVVAFSVAAIPPLLLIPAYSWACFGDPFTLPYSHQASFPAMKEGLYAIKWPDPATVFNLLFSPTRGLFFWTPFLLMAGFGYRELFDRAPRMFWLTYLVPLVQVLVISGRIWDWQAGPTLGPRLLAPMLPLLALPCALGVARWPRLGAVLGVYSIAITTLATLTDACPSYEIYNPLTELHIPLFLKGEFSPNLGMVLGLPPHASVALYYLILIGGVWWLWWLCGKPRQEVQQGRNHAD